MVYRKIVAGFVCVVLILLAAPGLAVPQKPRSLFTKANGKGSIKVGGEEFQLRGVVLKLKEDGHMELTLVSDITLFFEGTWSSDEDLSKGIDIKLNGGATGAVQGDGKVFLRDDGKALARMTLRASNRFHKMSIELRFVAD